MAQHFLQAAIVATITVLASVRCQADLIIRIEDTTLRAGGVGSLDIWVRSDSSDTFGLASYMLRIDPIAQIGGMLEFQPSFVEALDLHQSNSEQLDPEYLFAGDTDVDNFFAARQDPDRTRLVGTDEAAGGNITIESPVWYLLGRVELQHVTPTPVTSHGIFRVSLIADPANTYFQNLELDDLDSNQPIVNPISYSLANSGVVIVNSVPEPASLPWIFAAVGVVLVRRRA